MVKERDIPNFSKRLEGYLSKLKTKPSIRQQSNLNQSCSPLNKATNNSHTKVKKEKFSDMKNKSTIKSTVHLVNGSNQNKLCEKPSASKSGELYNRKKIRAFNFIFDCLQQDDIVTTESLQNSNIYA
jgi:hypothetical protein